jgi:hypothetical protein
MLGAVTLQSAQVVRVTQFGSQLLEDPPILFRSVRADLTFKVTLQVRRDAASSLSTSTPVFETKRRLSG